MLLTVIVLESLCQVFTMMLEHYIKYSVTTSAVRRVDGVCVCVCVCERKTRHDLTVRGL